MRILPLLILLLLAPVAGIAGQSSIVYSKATIRIVPQPGTIGPQPAAPQSDAAAAKPADAKKDGKAAQILPVPVPTPAPQPPRETKEISVEVRPLGILEQKEFIVHEPFSDSKGLLILIDPPQSLPLRAAPLLGRTDVLLVLTDGIIAKIAPNLILTELDEPIQADSPVRAFVFLKAGLAEASDIQPGDRVQSALFKTHPVVLDSPNRTIIIGNSPPGGTDERSAQQPPVEEKAKTAPVKKRGTAPAAALPGAPVTSTPPAESQQLMQELQK